MDYDKFLDKIDSIEGFKEAIKERLVSLWGKKAIVELITSSVIRIQFPDKTLFINVNKFKKWGKENNKIPAEWEIVIDGDHFNCKISRKLIKYEDPYHGIKINYKPKFDFALISDYYNLFIDLYYLIKDCNDIAKFIIDYINVLA